MNRLQYITRYILLLVILCVMSGVACAMHLHLDEMPERPTYDKVPLGIRYTKSHPLVVVADWAFKPYSFINDHGEPDGFQADLIKELFSNLHVNYEIRCMEWKKAKQELADNRAQLMIDIDKSDEVQDLHYGKAVLAEYEVGVVHLKSTMHIRSMELLERSDTVFFNYKDYADFYVKKMYPDSLHFVRKYMEPYDALHALLRGEVKYYVWGKASLRTLIRKYGLENDVVLEDIDIAPGKFRFMSSDQALLDELDSYMEILKRQQRYQPICEMWLEGNTGDYEGSTLMEIVGIVLFVVFVVIMVISFIVIQRSSGTGDLKKEFQTISRMAISLTDCQVLAISVRNSWVYNVFGDFLPEGGLSSHDYENLIHPDDIQVEYDIRRAIDSGTVDAEAVSFRMKRYNDTTDDWRNMTVHAFVKTNRRGKPVHVYLVFVDETERKREQAELDHTLREFRYITEISDIGMCYYDAYGNMVNCNSSILSILGRGDAARAERYLRRSTIQDIPVVLNGIIMEPRMDVWFCGPIDIPELALRMHAEIRIQSVHDEDGNNSGYSLSISPLDEVIELRHSERVIDRKLTLLKQELTRYQGEMRFILRRNNMNTFRWNKGSDVLEVSHDLLSFDIRTPIRKYYDLVAEDEKDEAQRILDDPEAFFSEPRNFVRSFLRLGSNEKEWYVVNSIPEYDDEGNFKGAFGIRTDITPFMLSQENLRRETAKAEDSGKQKSLFLANMTHELRTPLNAINGFAEILKMFSTPEEKKEYVEIMSNNCTMLIAIIDNILQLSIMDTDGLTLKPRGIDFAAMFPVSARKMAKYVTSPNVRFLMDTPLSSLPLVIDYDRVMQVLEAFVNNASKFTQKGFVRVGYSYTDNTLYVYCRDTGCGIPDDKQQAIFERFVKLNDFVQGTGLGLSISSIIAEHLGAEIYVYSREGHGSTFTLKIPISINKSLT